MTARLKALGWTEIRNTLHNASRGDEILFAVSTACKTILRNTTADPDAKIILFIPHDHSFKTERLINTK